MIERIVSWSGWSGDGGGGGTRPRDRPKQNKPQKTTTTTTRLLHARTLRQSSLARPARQAGGVSRGDLGEHGRARVVFENGSGGRGGGPGGSELETMERMDKALEKLSENLMTVRTKGKPSHAGRCRGYYGAPTQLSHWRALPCRTAPTSWCSPSTREAWGRSRRPRRWTGPFAHERRKHRQDKRSTVTAERS